MFGLFKKKKKADERFSQPLSPEADKFPAGALEEYGQKEEALEQGWRLSACAEYALNDETGLFSMKLDDGRAWEADAQIRNIMERRKVTRLRSCIWSAPCADSMIRKSPIRRVGVESLSAPMRPRIIGSMIPPARRPFPNGVPMCKRILLRA
jgi:hypothetical protein